MSTKKALLFTVAPILLFSSVVAAAGGVIGLQDNSVYWGMAATFAAWAVFCRVLGEASDE